MGAPRGLYGRTRPGSKPQRPRNLKRKRETEDLDELCQRVAALDHKPLTPPEAFGDLPLSQATQNGLEASHFKELTSIQAQSIPASLKGLDILGAAKTGSGKTLAFLVPVLENLYRKRWTEYDGVGALILSPTRELAIQIFDVLRKVGRHHTFSAGLVIGGKSLQEERDRLGRMNILVATPGRMLQHMDQTAELDIANLQMLVLDEADRIMDMGFRDTLDALIEHLPPDRQTLMFSATQTKKVSDLARLSLSDPEFVAVHEAAESATPATLQQNYVVTALPEKLDTLWSFLRANTKKKILVFLSSGKQVRFVYESFRRLQPGIPLLHLHGRQKQTARLDITTKFSNSTSACLFSTDVAARGLDFPSVDWVIQLDAPEDTDTYIHRVGRTARFNSEGHAIIFLDPSEEQGMLRSLAAKKVVLEKINVRQKKMQDTIRNQLQNMCFKDPELKYLGQKAFVSYVRSVHIQKDKETFNLKQLDLEGFAASMGLPGTPRVKFVKGEDAKARKNAPRQLLAALSDSEDDEGEQRPKKKEVRTKYDRMFERRNQDVLADHYTKLIDDSDPSTAHKPDATADADSDHDFLSVKRRFAAGDADLGHLSDSEPSETESLPNGTKKKTVQLSTNPGDQPLVVDSNRRAKLLQSRKALLKYKGHGTHLTFDSDSDTPQNKKSYVDEDAFHAAGDAAAQKEAFLAKERERTGKTDILDKEVARQKRRDKKERAKARARAEEAADHDDDGGSGANDAVQYYVPGNEEHINPFADDDRFDYDAEEKEDEEKETTSRPRPKKWFEDPSTDDDDGDDAGRKSKRAGTKKRKTRPSQDEPQTLEDLEALASGLLAAR